MSENKTNWNQNNSAIKRIMSELKEMRKNPPQEFIADHLENNLFEWHFTLFGAKDTDYEGGCYHGRIVLPPEYPKKAPDLYILTPNGRFETHKKICLSNTSYHQESWSPLWGIKTMLKALQAYMPTEDTGVGALNYPSSTRKEYAKQSNSWSCTICSMDHSTIEKNIQENVENKQDLIKLNFKMKEDEPIENENKIEEIEIVENKTEEIEIEDPMNIEDMYEEEKENKEEEKTKPLPERRTEVVKKNSAEPFKIALNIIILFLFVLIQLMLLKKFSFFDNEFEK
eukprot:gene716-8968_t